MKNKVIQKKKYYLFNSEKFVLGRMSAKIAFLLQGKNNPHFAPNKLADIFVVVVNTDKLKVTGNKKDSKKYHLFSGYPGGITSRNLDEMIENDSRKVIYESVYGMLPKNKLRDLMMKRLLIFKSEKHNISSENIEEITG